MKYPVTSNRLIIITAVFLTAFFNFAFFSNLTQVYPVNTANLGFLASLVAVLVASIILILGLACYRYTIKPVLMTVLLVSSLAAYFMDTYNIIIDDSMIQSILATDMAEASDLFSPKLLVYFTLLGILPAVFVYRADIAFRPAWRELVSRLKLTGIALVAGLALIVLFGGSFSSFSREHKPLRYYTNPGTYIYSSIKYLDGLRSDDTRTLTRIGEDARIPPDDPDRELVILVVGEAARADRFSLNGYPRQTNPLLAREKIISFTNFWSCGTTTAVSVPCMFSIYPAPEFDRETGLSTENVLDVLAHAGVNVLWLDNNSDSKGVASRVAYQSYRSPEVNPECDIECRDVGMLENLEAYIDAHPRGDILIVLHQMGEHGPAYYKRYPPAFEKFTPVCRTSELGNCTAEEIGNAYDNALLYTDYFLSRTIDLLKQYDGEFETALLYVSDHGESLGENGLYLHGLPAMIAPDTQRHVAALMWIGERFDDLDRERIAGKRAHRYSHDNLFSTLLGFMEIRSSVYDGTMDILHDAE